MKIAVVTDSTAYLEPEVAEQYGIKVVPIPFIIDNKVYNEGIDITTEEFYSKLKLQNHFQVHLNLQSENLLIYIHH